METLLARLADPAIGSELVFDALYLLMLWGLVGAMVLRWRRIPPPARPVGGALVLASLLFTLPVLLWIQRIPLLGLLMIPKSLAYLAVALTVYRRLPSMAPITSR